MAANGCKWLEIAGNGWEWLEWLNMAEKFFKKFRKKTENGRKWLEGLDMAVNGCKWL